MALIQQNEVISFVILLAMISPLIKNKATIKQLPSLRLYLTSFFALLLAHLITIIEVFFWQDLMNNFEHLLHTVSAIFFFLWCFSLRNETEGKYNG